MPRYYFRRITYNSWGSEVCLRCNRRINLTRRGQFRKHVASKGVECCGSWEFVDIQKARISAASEATQHTLAADVLITCAKCGTYHSVYIQCPNGLHTPHAAKA